MKKAISALLVFLMVMLSLLPAWAFAEEGSTGYDVTLGEIQQELIDYASITGTKIEPGTDSYYNYIVSQLLDYSDQKLREHPHYDLIHAYMAEYKVAYEDYLFCREVDDDYRDDIVGIITRSNDCVRVDVVNNEVAFELSTSFLSKTIADIIRENQEKEALNKADREQVRFPVIQDHRLLLMQSNTPTATIQHILIIQQIVRILFRNAFIGADLA